MVSGSKLAITAILSNERDSEFVAGLYGPVTFPADLSQGGIMTKIFNHLKLKPSLSLLTISMTLGLVGCGGSPGSGLYGDDGGSADDGTGGGSGGADRLFTCQSSSPPPTGSFDLSLSADGSRALVTLAGNTSIYTRSDAPDDSDTQPGSFIEYQSSGAVLDELQLEGPMVVSGATQGQAQLDNATFTCHSI